MVPGIPLRVKRTEIVWLWPALHLFITGANVTNDYKINEMFQQIWSNYKNCCKLISIEITQAAQKIPLSDLCS